MPSGTANTINDIRLALAKKHIATIGFPIPTGKFAWIAAYAAGETKKRGENNITPYWRMLKSGSLLNEKIQAESKLTGLFWRRKAHCS
jgi:hypothetical protein